MKRLWYLFKYFLLWRRVRKDFYDPNFEYYDEIDAVFANPLIDGNEEIEVPEPVLIRKLFTADTHEWHDTYNMSDPEHAAIFNRLYLIKKIKNWKGEWVRDE